MILKTRRLLFYGFLFLFLITGTAIILYSRGWRINTGDCSIARLRDCKINFQKTGAIFIATKPQGVTIEIDRKFFKDKSGLVQNGTLITNLLPKTYKVLLSKDGYYSWQKDFRVFPEFVAKATKVILIPEKIEKNPVPFNRLRGDRLLGVNNSGKKFIIEDLKREIYYLYDLDKPGSVFNINVNFQNLKKDGFIKKIAFHPFDPNKLLIETNSGIYILDVARIQVENAVLKEPIAWTVKNPNLYYLGELKSSTSTLPNKENVNKEYILISFNLVIKNQTATYDLPLLNPNTQISALIVSDSQNKIAYLTSSGDLYVMDLRNSSLKKIAHNAESFIVSPDSKKIAFVDKNSERLNIYFLEDDGEGPFKRAGELATLDPKNISSMKDISWYNDSAHIFIQYLGADKKQKIDFVEIDDRPPLNQEKLIEGISNFYYDPNLNSAYFIQENSLYSFAIEK